MNPLRPRLIVESCMLPPACTSINELASAGLYYIYFFVPYGFLTKYRIAVELQAVNIVVQKE